MKVQTNQQPNGSVLLISLVIATIILVSLASYLLLVSNENQSVTRDQDWNACVPVMEAGVEEALTQIHYSGLANLSANSWSLGADGNYHKNNRTVGTNGSYCNVTIQPVNPPIIYSEAYTVAPLCSSSYVVREVRVTTKTTSPWGGGLTAKGGITFGGKGVFDSYNSSVGPYNPANHGTNAVALTDAGTAGAITLGGGKIYGMTVTGPGGTVSASGQASVGDTNWIGGGSLGVEPGWSANDANVQFNDEAAPYSGGIIPTSGLLGGTNYTYLLNGVLVSKYYMTSLSLNASQIMMVVGNVTLYVTGNLTVSGSAAIVIAPGSSLNLYLGGNMNCAGQGVVNQTLAPANFIVHGLPTCTSISYSGGNDFYGVVNAPECNLSFSGGSSAYGAFVANSISLTGQGGVHYDEALGSAPNYAVASWNEITPQ